MAYFYCGDSRFGQSWADPDEVMRSLTPQFAIVDREKLKVHEQIALEYARREAEAKLDGFEIPRLQSTQCADLVLGILGANPVVIIVDGVDEIEEHRRHELLDALVRIRDESASVVKIFLSSRDNSNVFATLVDASMLRVQETDTRQDMELFIEHCVSTAISTRNLLDGSVSDDLRKEIKQFLLGRAGEMFLWVQLQVERLCKFKSTGSILEVLNDPLKSLTTTDNLYSDILENLVQADSLAYATAVRAFSWLLCMREPLSSTAFIDAVSSGTPDAHHLNLSELLSICSNLIVHDKQLDTLRFAHISCKEFLESKPEFDAPSAHTIATLSCIESCTHHSPLNVEGELHAERDYSLYAVMYWAQHYTAVKVPSSRQDEIFEALCQHNRNLLVSQNLLAAAVTSADAYGPVNHLKSLLERANDVEISTEIFKSVRSAEVLELLLQHEPRSAITSDIFEALADVDYYGHSLVKLLLDREPQAVPTSSVIISVLRKSKPFSFSDKDVVDLLLLLLDRNPDIQISESMLVASQHPEPLRILLSRTPGFPVRNELVKSVVSREYIGAELLKIILNHDKSLQIDQASLNACLEEGTPDCLELILENNPELSLPLELILNKLKSIQKYEKNTAFKILEVLVRLGKKQTFTPEFYRAVEEQFQLQSESDMKQLFLSLEKRD